MVAELSRYIDGNRVQLPLNSDQANDLEWVHVLPGEYLIDSDKYEEWCSEHVEDGLYFVGAILVWFKREQDATMFRLRWAV